jgi:hypothetical protein
MQDILQILPYCRLPMIAERCSTGKAFEGFASSLLVFLAANWHLVRGTPTMKPSWQTFGRRIGCVLTQLDDSCC